MDPQSPPKRMTRSRAAAKATDTSSKTTRIVTAAAKAKAASSTTTTATRSTSTKRKTRADDNEHEDDIETSAAPAKTARPRGRPRKVVDSEPAVEAKAPALSTAARATRTRAKKATEPAEPTESEPPKPKRGRPRKVTTQENEEPKPEPVKTTRSRAASITTKATVKKTVTFQEPEKENIDPGASSKQKADTKATAGLRGRPVRKAATTATTTTKPASATATRATRAARATKATTSKAAEKLPLSPKKITQLTAPLDYPSEDELAAPEKTPLRKNPVRPPPSSALVKSKKLELAAEERTLAINNASVEGSEPTLTMALVSPAKRPPPSPFKDTMKSPAKRSDAVQLASASSAQQSVKANGTTPFKASLLQSPAKRPPLSALKAMAPSSLARPEPSAAATPSFRSSLLQSPAKRLPMSAMKLAPVQPDVNRTPATRPTILSTPGPASHAKPSELLMDDEEADATPQDIQRTLFSQPPPSLKFPGRLSAVLPRDANPGLDLDMAAVDEVTEDDISLVTSPSAKQNADTEASNVVDVENDSDDTIVDEDHEMSDVPEAAEEEEQQKEMPLSPTGTTTPPNSPPKNPFGYGLRQKDLNPFQGLDDESDDELTSSIQRKPSRSPVRYVNTPSAGSRRKSIAPSATGVGFTPLAARFNAWSATSPVKPASTSSRSQSTPEQLGTKPSFFEDEMSVRDPEDVEAAIEAAIDADIAALIEPVFEDVPITEEDMALVTEAQEMSLMEPEQIEEMLDNQHHDDSLSEDSQDYGDENQVPIDPAILEGQREMTTDVPPQTPARQVVREFHTVSKVPLKPADDSTPSPLKKRRHSVSRLPVQRPCGVKRSATVISYTPTRKEQSTPKSPAAVDSDIWSTLGTPPRSPHKHLDPALLRGAVVYVDVHTSEGADASGIFVELLTQMGARCVKTWNWNSNESSRIGITHVVYKDGSKRTLERVRESNGVVQCVGVTWVLDCERDNKWLDEAPYSVDTSLVPRGGGRRRKSMEPKALANLNGMLVTSPVKQSRDTQTAPSTPLPNRRASTVWMRTPPEQLAATEDHDGEGEIDDDDDWRHLAMLTPVPKTPAPEAIARYVENITPDTPTEAGGSPEENDLLMRTCPPKKMSANTYRELGQSIFSPEKDPQVMMRLMAARRKSLQFAPKIGSPLSKAWN
ncbi:hypothetical protein jhhlp_000931 [Lomentospora prolificans]|uniref:BRCT domain-containing protein n=1 Tax=Lomentospora prolificans TaxID=41688 RepID=A0A2N3NJV8_9PEZI|nr:hypothetical protein jhhlp_000931 [Lomentospora prolificans]